MLADHNLDWKLETTAKGCVMHDSYRMAGNFGGEFILADWRQYFHPPNVFQYAVIRDVINMSSTIVQNVRTKASNFERMEQK